MTIAELFVDLGVKGDAKSGQAVDGVTKKLNETASAGLAAKAAIVAAVYGLERLTSWAASKGTSLKQFDLFTGLEKGGERLQDWENLFRQVGVGAEDANGSLQAVQQSMTNMLAGKGAPEGMGMLAQTLGDFDYSKARDSFYVMEKLTEFAKKTKNNPDLANRVLGSFGLSHSVIAGMRDARLELDKLGSGSKLFKNQYEQLNRIDVAWQNFWHTLRMVGAGLVASHGMKGVGFLNESLKTVISVSKNLGKLITEIPAVQSAMVLAGSAIALAWKPWITGITGALFLLNEYQKGKDGKENFFTPGGGMDKKLEGLPGGEAVKSFFDWWTEVGAEGSQREFDRNQMKLNKFNGPVPLGTTSPQGNTYNISVKATGIRDADQLAGIVQKKLQSEKNKTGRQLKQGRVN